MSHQTLKHASFDTIFICAYSWYRIDPVQSSSTSFICNSSRPSPVLCKLASTTSMVERHYARMSGALGRSAGHLVFVSTYILEFWPRSRLFQPIIDSLQADASFSGLQGSHRLRFLGQRKTAARDNRTSQGLPAEY